MDGKSRFFMSGIFTYLAPQNQTAPIDLPDGFGKIIERLRQKNQTALIGMISN